MDLFSLVEPKYVAAALLFSLIGVIIFVVAFVLLDVLTPKVSVWRELVEKQNMAMAVFLGSVVIGIALIVSSAIHG
jgi:putative membrane protein